MMVLWQLPAMTVDLRETSVGHARRNPSERASQEGVVRLTVPLVRRQYLRRMVALVAD